VKRVHRRQDLSLDAYRLVGLGQLHFDLELAEIGRVLAGSPGLALVKRHHVVVDSGEGLPLKAIPESLRVGGDSLIQQDLVASKGAHPARGHVDHFVIAEAVDVGPQDHARRERLSQKLCAPRCRHHLVGRRLGRSHLEAHPLSPNSEIARQDLVDGERFVEPPDVGSHRLVGPLDGRPVERESDHDLVNGASLESGPDDLVEPAVPLLERREDTHHRIPGSLPLQLFPDLRFQVPANLFCLREPNLDLDRLPPSRPGKNPGAEEPPEIIDFGGNLDFVLEQGPGALDVAVVDDDVEDLGTESGCAISNTRFEARVRLLDRDQHFRAAEILSLQSGEYAVELVESGRCLTRRRAAREKIPEIPLDVVQRRSILSALPDVGEPHRQLIQRASDSGFVASLDRERGLLSEGSRNHPDGAPLLRRERPFPPAGADALPRGSRLARLRGTRSRKAASRSESISPLPRDPGARRGPSSPDAVPPGSRRRRADRR
jgi:hypothetical protein